MPSAARRHGCCCVDSMAGQAPPNGSSCRPGSSSADQARSGHAYRLEPSQPEEHRMTYVPAPARYDDIEYRRSGRSGLRLPAISLGLWQNFGETTASETQRAIIRRAFDLGVTHFDLANNYGPPAGAAETNFGRILAEDLASHRNELIISSKAGYDMWP